MDYQFAAHQGKPLDRDIAFPNHLAPAGTHGSLEIHGQDSAFWGLPIGVQEELFPPTEPQNLAVRSLTTGRIGPLPAMSWQ